MKNKLIHFMILTSLVAGGGFGLISNLHAQENFDVDAAIEARNYSAVARYYQNLADQKRDIAEESHQLLRERSSGYGRGGQYYWESHYGDLHDKALEEAERYEELAEKYKKMIDENEK